METSYADDRSLKQKVHSLIQQDLTASEHLFDLLEQEREALQARRYPDLVTLLEEKAKALDLLDQHAQQRFDLLAEAGMAQSDAAWCELLDALADPHIHRDWQTLLDSVRNCRHSNIINGTMVARGRQTLGRLLTILRGQISVPELYDQSGAPQSGNNSHTMIKV